MAHSDTHSDTRSDTSVPKYMLLALAGLVGFAFVIVSVARISELPTAPIAIAPVVETLTVTFVDREDGAVVALRADDGAVQAVIEPETGGFVRGVLRSLVRRRMQLGLGREAGGFDLNRLSDGQITLSDPATGEIVDLGAFGPTNQAAFAAIMSPELAR
jgi:putative photosynthetic complex assembly protein